MSMVQCANGHFYNSTANNTCPHCQGQVPGLGKTIGVTPPKPNLDFMKNTDRSQTSSPPNFPVQEVGDVLPRSNTPANEGKTIGLYMKKEGIDPVVGWLVCIEGKDRGKDYRIHSEKNTIGRSELNDIHITGDQTISRDNHATITFDPKRKSFRLLAGGGRGLVYVNDEAVDYSIALKKKDIIEMGETKLLFVPLCGDDFDW